LQPGQPVGSAESRWVFPSFIFSSTRLDSDFKLIGFQINLLDQTGFQNYITTKLMYQKHQNLAALTKTLENILTYVGIVDITSKQVLLPRNGEILVV
jgi:hypothetical protein